MRTFALFTVVAISASSLTAQQVMTAAISVPAHSGVASSPSNADTPELSANDKRIVLVTNINVGAESGIEPEAGVASYRASARDILSSAGTYGDFSRYLQLFPGVTFNNDASDDVLVRGGNPTENLYQVDGIDIPNINHIATQGTTGGLVSMIDTSAIQDVDFLTGGYDASYDERLSSVVSIHTREFASGKRYSQIDAGFIGAGGTIDLPTRSGGSVMISGHRSLLNLFTNDIGFGGVPIFTNALIRISPKTSSANAVTFLALGGIDSIKVKPNFFDIEETNSIDMQYRGWRGTAGFRWQHLFSADAFGILTVSDSESSQNIHQQDQIYNDWLPTNTDPRTIPPTEVYSEATHDGISEFKYDFHLVHGSSQLSSGVDQRFHRAVYDVAQPNGEQSPFSSNPTRSDATSFTSDFGVGEAAIYSQFSYRLNRWAINAGFRGQVFYYDRHKTITPRLSTSYRISSILNAHASFGEYAQMPAYIQLESFAQNHILRPMRNQQGVVGLDANWGKALKLKLEAYRKDYRDYPVSSEYPSLSLANQVDTLGREFVWLPLVSAGRGNARGIELSAESHLGSRLYLAANAALSQDKYSGLDGVLRPGNFDYPVVLNAAGTYRTAKRYEVSYRYEFSSGRPYTPFLPQVSYLQDRPVYDLTQVNALRGPYYSRLDFSLSRNFYLKDRLLTVYGGLENAFDRKNFLGYAWMQKADIYLGCNGKVNDCIEEETQMDRFPNFGVRYSF